MNRDLKTRSKLFAHDCVKIALSLPQTYLGNHVRNQLVRSSTSVAANYRAAQLGQSKRSFIAKLSIVIEEADECVFWMEFLIDEGLLSRETCAVVLKEAGELTAIFVTSRKTAEKTDNRG
ncbi:four helix bundle protein [Gramella sp. GC03-9]|uniref:Four helix bundle protein n=1 Tax=Christiangramia oceanisediminis TaxID=2920386 RepID=A0A9X2KZ72_9FLAO|nr:four helix bundle protein [Gramella oceanisediminis]MCP9201080.1 four helix bundle protein [Gramella oceanisediminis]